jgi:hypothetical protein
MSERNRSVLLGVRVGNFVLSQGEDWSLTSGRCGKRRPYQNEWQKEIHRPNYSPLSSSVVTVPNFWSITRIAWLFVSAT